MATTGTNYTVTWEITDGTLRIFPTNGISGIARTPQTFYSNDGLISFLNGVTDEEFASVHTIIFEEDVAFQEWKSMGWGEDPRYAPAGFFNFFRKTASESIAKDVLNENIQKIDVSGLNTINASSFEGLFRGLTNLTELVGLNNLNTQSVTKFNYMFRNTPLSSINISNWIMGQGSEITGMFESCNYLQSLTLPSNFNRTNTGTDLEVNTYRFGLVPKGKSATKNSVTVASDEDFFKLTSSQGGAWERDLSGVATLSFKVTSSIREGNEATLSFNYLTTSATAKVYLKKSTDSSFPSSPVKTTNFNGTGSSSTVLQLTTDDAYDVMIIVDDGETTLYTYPSIDSNILLFQIDEEGNVEASGDITDGQGNVLSDKADSTALAQYIPLTGGTLTGALNCTDIMASGDIEDGSGNVLSDKADTTDLEQIFVPTTDTAPVITASVGQVREKAIVKTGRTVQLMIAVSKTSATPVGSNVFSGTIEQRYRPKALVNGIGYYGSCNGVLQLDPSGNLTIRITGAQLPANGTIYVSATYVV